MFETLSPSAIDQGAHAQWPMAATAVPEHPHAPCLMTSPNE